MNNLKLKILECAYARPGLTIGGLADVVSRGQRTEKDVQRLLQKGYLLDERGLELSKKGIAVIDSASFKNRIRLVAKCLFGMMASVVAVVIGNWLWNLIQPFL